MLAPFLTPIAVRRRHAAGRWLALAAVAGLIGCAAPTGPAATATAQAPAASPNPSPGAADYAVRSHWLCLPGRDDACAQPLVHTLIAADGTLTRQAPLVARADAPIDCFYVYPTVSLDEGGNSDLVAGPEERSVAFVQASPFRAECRVFAPLYRQITIKALRSRFTGTPMAVDAGMAYRDVVAAWNHYLANDNRGRGVVLIGHSQGARMLTDLMAREIEGKPVATRVISLLAIGSPVLVPQGREVGSSLQSTPLCRSPQQTGCVISYASFRADAPPPANSLFGKPAGDRIAVCTNPADLGGKAGPTVSRTMFAVRRDGLSGSASDSWLALMRRVGDSAFMSPVGMVRTQCVDDAHGSYLAAEVRPDARADNIGGDVIAAGRVQANWGLHLIDMNLVLGDLVDVVRQQGLAWGKK